MRDDPGSKNDDKEKEKVGRYGYTRRNGAVTSHEVSRILLHLGIIGATDNVMMQAPNMRVLACLVCTWYLLPGVYLVVYSSSWYTE